MMVLNHCASVPFVKKITFNENALLRNFKKLFFLENQHYRLNIEDIFNKFTGHPMNQINMMSSKGQVYAKKTVDFISKKEGPVYFEQHCIYIQTLSWENQKFNYSPPSVVLVKLISQMFTQLFRDYIIRGLHKTFHVGAATLISMIFTS